MKSLALFVMIMEQVYRYIKSVIPNSWKFPFWYVFKAPQRQVGSHTLRSDIKGLLIFIARNIFQTHSLRPVTICTGIYNRSENYTGPFLESICDAAHQELIELSVYDCGSDDVTSLHEEIRKKWKGKLVFTQEHIPFSRAHSFNRAVKAATSEIVLICDADLSLPPDIVSLCNKYVAPKQAWYPIYFFLYKNRPVAAGSKNGIWEHFGSKGLFACLKKDYMSIGGLNEEYKTWGYEDTELWLRFHQQHYIIIRNRQKNLFHHWHTTHNPKYSYLN